MNKLHWVVRHVNGKQVREDVYGELNALKRLVELDEEDSYVWTPGCYAIELDEAKYLLELSRVAAHN